MSVRVDINDHRIGRSGIIVTFTSRISTAIRMLQVTRLLNREQETAGELDDLDARIEEINEKYKVNASVQYEFFEGHNDAILEFKLHILQFEKRDKELPEVESEAVMGTLLKLVIDHFDWRWLDFDKEDWKHDNYKHLEVLRK